jgi:hypothetical protein
LASSAYIRALGPNVRDCICSGEEEESRQASYLAKMAGFFTQELSHHHDANAASY